MSFDDEWIEERKVKPLLFFIHDCCEDSLRENNEAEICIKFQWRRLFFDMSPSTQFLWDNHNYFLDYNINSINVSINF